MHKKRPFLVHVPKDMYRKRPFSVHIYTHRESPPRSPLGALTPSEELDKAGIDIVVIPS